MMGQYMSIPVMSWSRANKRQDTATQGWPEALIILNHSAIDVFVAGASKT